MDQRLSLVTLATSDLHRAIRFYEGLGWQPKFQNQEVAFFPLNGIVLALFRKDAFAAELGVSADSLIPGAVALAYNVRAPEEMEPIFAKVAAEGGTIITKPRDREWGGRSGYFADPDGHRWEVAWNPAWTIDADGDVHMA